MGKISWWMNRQSEFQRLSDNTKMSINRPFENEYYTDLQSNFDLTHNIDGKVRKCRKKTWKR